MPDEVYKCSTPEHLDQDFITILSTLGYPGLQIEVDNTGVYKTVKCFDDHLIINIGELFSHITNYTFRATRHRVLDIGIKRYSCPFFLVPKYKGVLPANFLNPEEEPLKPTMVYGDWIIMRYNINRLPNYSNRYRDPETGKIAFRDVEIEEN